MSVYEGRRAWLSLQSQDSISSIKECIKLGLPAENNNTGYNK